METKFIVEGMTCVGCSQGLQSVLSGMSGVAAVQVDLTSGLVTLTSDQPLAAEPVLAEISSLGFKPQTVK